MERGLFRILLYGGDLSLLTHLFIYSIIYLYLYRPLDIYFMLWIKSFFLPQFFQLWPLGAPSISFGVPLMYTLSFIIFLSVSLFSSTIRCPRLILYIPRLSPKISHFSKESWFLLSETGVRNQDLGTVGACYH